MSTRRTVLLGVGYHDRFNGAQRSLLVLALALQERGYRVLGLFTGDGRGTRAFSTAGIETRVLQVPETINLYNKAWLSKGGWRAKALVRALPRITVEVARLVRSEGVDLVHANEPRALLLFGWGAKATGTPLVLHARGSVRGVYPRPLLWLIQVFPQLIIRDAHLIVSDMSPRFRRKVRVVYPAVDPPSAVDQRVPHQFTVLTLASFTPYKGYHHLAEAASLVAREVGDSIRFVWVGDAIDPEYHRWLCRRVRDLRLGNVAIHEWQPDVSELLAGATAYVQPTIERECLQLDGHKQEVWCAEGIPGAVLEALSWEKPTIGTAVGGIPEVLQHESTGLLAPPGDPEALAAAILCLYRSPELRRRLGAAGRRLVVERFTRNDFVEGVVQVYDELFE